MRSSSCPDTSVAEFRVANNARISEYVNIRLPFSRRRCYNVSVIANYVYTSKVYFYLFYLLFIYNPCLGGIGWLPVYNDFTSFLSSIANYYESIYCSHIFERKKFLQYLFLRIYRYVCTCIISKRISSK